MRGRKSDISMERYFYYNFSYAYYNFSLFTYKVDSVTMGKTKGEKF